MSKDAIQQSLEVLRPAADSLKPTVGVVLGSGLGEVVEALSDPRVIPYSSLQGFPYCSVDGHVGEVTIGCLNGVCLVVLRGRTHFYEGSSADLIRTPIHTLKALGCQEMIFTNAAGSLTEAVGPGQLMLIRDHINFQGRNPLVGSLSKEQGDPFISLENAYDSDNRALFLACAKSLNIPLSEGVYIAVLGPSFETPAEVQLFKQWGAHAVGMSTVPEVIVARQAGLKVSAISVVTNYGAGMGGDALSHGQTLSRAQGAAKNLTALLSAYVGTRETS